MFLCMYKNVFNVFDLCMFLETCKIKPICLSHISRFLHSLRCSRAVSLTLSNRFCTDGSGSGVILL